MTAAAASSRSRAPRGDRPEAGPEAARPRYLLDQPRRGVAGHRPRHDLLPLSLMIWGVLSPWSAGANDR